MTIEEHWKKFLACNDDSFGAIYEETYKGLINLSYEMLKSSYSSKELALGDAEDIVMAVLIEEIYAKKKTDYGQIEKIETLPAYMRTAVENRTRNRIKQIGLHRSNDAEDADKPKEDHPSRGLDLDDDELKERYEAVLSRFPPEERKIWRKVREERWPIEQVMSDHNLRRRHVERIISKIEKAMANEFGDDLFA